MPERVDIDEYLDKDNPKMNKVALKLRNLILEMFPDMNEVIKWKNLVYEKEGYVCAILIHKAHINIEFWRGTEFQDPENRLEGTGKKLRHIKIKSESDIDVEYIKKLIQESIELNILN
ncbi:MAG: DUF1801 domain-containing protein [Methanobacterium sp.]|nr:DUF1801 domain-containing protein [Methanobacterium sp.]